MIKRVDQQLRVNKLMIDYYDLSDKAMVPENFILWQHRAIVHYLFEGCALLIVNKVRNEHIQLAMLSQHLFQ